ncbi:spermatogenesis-associated protein 17 [Stegastes partitus]|uniref:Spermatogenesis-associated protein 17 n=1 Tax=Stegastes partitus TaxID=144197 RepID=A0A9Y4KDB9_9TELE|nr:PREDICTED: spermatogenesis-associated protein 17 [Stegastes partitus]
MAELLKLQSEIKEFPKEYFYRNSQAQETRQEENQAATRIQSWFRACKVRAYLSHLHKKAIIIQKIWRGFTARARVRQMVKAAYFIMKMNFYEEMAVRIQRRWRGFFVRKYIHNFYARKSYLEGVTMKNESVRRELDELEELQKRERDCLAMVKEQTAKVYQAHRLHHLVSTKQCPGVFNSPFRPAPHEMELLLRQVKYQTPTRLAPRGRARPLGIPSPTAPSFPGTLGSPWIKTSRTCCSRPVLPPIVSKKQQGLYREPGEVWEQRVQCPDLMLCLQTSYTHLEEAQNQLQQKETGALSCSRRPLPSGGTIAKEGGTGGMLHRGSHSSSSFTQPAYTSKSFRRKNKYKNKCKIEIRHKGAGLELSHEATSDTSFHAHA